VEDTWTNRDLPVLDAVVRLLRHDSVPEVGDIATETGMTVETVAAALHALDGTFVDLQLGLSLESSYVRSVSADARRAVGQWPTAESLITRLAEGFSTAADREPDPDKKGRLRTVASMLGGASRDIAVEVAAKVVEHQMGMG
jgi:hypothetical protein